jgi:hypothetical protein
LHSSPGVIRVIKTRMIGKECNKNGEEEERNAYRTMVEKPE